MSDNNKVIIGGQYVEKVTRYLNLNSLSTTTIADLREFLDALAADGFPDDARVVYEPFNSYLPPRLSATHIYRRAPSRAAAREQEVADEAA